jgi:hypothetical protein
MVGESQFSNYCCNGTIGSNGEINNNTLLEPKLYPRTKHEVENPIVFPPDYTNYTLELLSGMLPKGYKIVKDTDGS